MKRRLLLALALALQVCAASAGSPVHGARAAAMGTAFVAVADDPSAFAYNPAGLALLKGEAQLYAGGSLVVPATTYRNNAGQSETTAFQAFPAPHLYLVPAVAEGEGRFGFGAFAPFGVGGRKWDAAGPTRYASTESLTGTFVLNPSYARRIAPSLYAGIGVDYMLAKSETALRVNQAALGAGDGDIATDMKGSGWGWNFGVLLALGESWSLGAAWRSPIRVKFSGDLRLRDVAPPLQALVGGPEFKTAVSSTLTFPAVASLGLAYRPSPHSTLSIDAEQVRWSSFRQTFLDLRDEIPAAGLVDRATPMEWKDVILFKAGWETRLGDGLAVRAGYAYVPSPVPDRTLTPASPDSTLHRLSAGFSHEARRGMTIDFFYTAAFGRARSVNNAALPGSYDNSMHYVGASVLWAY